MSSRLARSSLLRLHWDLAHICRRIASVLLECFVASDLGDASKDTPLPRLPSKLNCFIA